MRDIAEIKADIEFVRKDLNELRKMGASTSVAMEDLYELLNEYAHEIQKPQDRGSI